MTLCRSFLYFFFFSMLALNHVKFGLNQYTINKRKKIRFWIMTAVKRPVKIDALALNGLKGYWLFEETLFQNLHKSLLTHISFITSFDRSLLNYFSCQVSSQNLISLEIFFWIHTKWTKMLLNVDSEKGWVSWDWVFEKGFKKLKKPDNNKKIITS